MERRYDFTNKREASKTMIQTLLILIIVTQVGCASVFWETLGGTVIGNIVAEEIKDKIDEYAKDEAPKP